MNKTNEIETVASELGYTESMHCSALDYIIETARASVMVNQKNVELVAQVENLKSVTPEMLRSAHFSEGGSLLISNYSGGYELVSSVYSAMLKAAIKPTPTQCLNQIKAEAGRAGFIAGWISRVTVGTWDREVEADQYASSIAKGEL